MDTLQSARQHSRIHQEPYTLHQPPKLRVHLVDDNQDAVDSLARWMSLSGYETHVSYTGLDALEAAPGFKPDVMLIDIMLPGMDGYHLAASLRKREAFERVDFIAVTGLLNEEEFRSRSKDAKFSLHFAKPVDLDVLNAVLASLAKKKGLAR